MRAPLLAALVASCTTLPQPCPTPEPTPEPLPTPEPVPSLIAPRYVPVGTPFAISVCDGPFRPGRLASLDGYKLGTLSWNAASGCSYLLVANLNGAGVRRLTVDGAGDAQIVVLGKTRSH